MKLLLFVVFILIVLPGCGPLAPMWATWNGEAEYNHSINAKKVQIMDAEGRYEAAKFLAQAEIERAKGVATANQIIGDSLKNNESYLKWLYIEGLKERNGIETIYVPTEAGLPILEAGKRQGKRSE